MQPIIIKGRNSATRASYLEIDFWEGSQLGLDLDPDDEGCRAIQEHCEVRGADLIIHSPTRDVLLAIAQYVVDDVNGFDAREEEYRKFALRGNYDPADRAMNKAIMATATTLYDQLNKLIYRRNPADTGIRPADLEDMKAPLLPPTGMVMADGRRRNPLGRAGKAVAQRLDGDEALAERVLRAIGPNDTGFAITSPSSAVEFLYSLTFGRDQEALIVLATNRRLHVVDATVLTLGSDGFTIVDPKQVLRWAISKNAHGILMCHNHPSGVPAPSVQDDEVTSRMRKACDMVGIKLLDHVILADTEGVGATYFSYSEHGRL